MKLIVFVMVQFSVLLTIKGYFGISTQAFSSSRGSGWTTSSTSVSVPNYSISSSVTKYGPSSSYSSHSSQEDTPNQQSIINAINSGNNDEIYKVVTSDKTDVVASAIVGMGSQQSGQWWNMGRYVYQTGIEEVPGSWILQEIIKLFERIISIGGCDIVFKILQEVDGLAVNDATSEQLQAAFQGSQTLLKCVEDNTEFTVVQAQNLCVEASNCIFLMQSTRFLLNDVPECGARRVCNFIGFDQQPICERECET